MNFACRKKFFISFGMEDFTSVARLIKCLLMQRVKVGSVLAEAHQGAEGWRTPYNSIEDFEIRGAWNFRTPSVWMITALFYQKEDDEVPILVFEYNNVLKRGFIRGNGVDEKTATEITGLFHERFHVRFWCGIKLYIWSLQPSS